MLKNNIIAFFANIFSCMIVMVLAYSNLENKLGFVYGNSILTLVMVLIFLATGYLFIKDFNNGEKSFYKNLISVSAIFIVDFFTWLFAFPLADFIGKVNSSGFVIFYVLYNSPIVYSLKVFSRVWPNLLNIQPPLLILWSVISTIFILVGQKIRSVINRNSGV